jgi:hypothetical protein
VRKVESEEGTLQSCREEETEVSEAAYLPYGIVQFWDGGLSPQHGYASSNGRTDPDGHLHAVQDLTWHVPVLSAIYTCSVETICPHCTSTSLELATACGQE